MNDIIKHSTIEFEKEFNSLYGINVSILNTEPVIIGNPPVADILAWHKSQMELAYKKGVEDVKKHLQVQCLDYCEQQNGLDHCKNCGLSIDLIDNLK